MKLFDVYPLFNISITRGKGCKVWDCEGTQYLDLYGGHAVISIGHAHPHYVEAVSRQVGQLGFYSNSVIKIGRTTWQSQWLRGLPTVPHQQWCRSQRECAEACIVPHRTDTHSVRPKGVSRTHVVSGGGYGQSKDNSPSQCQRPCDLPAVERPCCMGGRTCERRCLRCYLRVHSRRGWHTHGHVRVCPRVGHSL